MFFIISGPRYGGIWGDMGDMAGYSGIQRDTAGYRGIQRDTAGYSGIQQDTTGYSGIQWDTAGCHKIILQSTVQSAGFEGSAGGGRRAGVRFGLVGVWASKRVDTKRITTTASTNFITQHYNHYTCTYCSKCSSTIYAILHYILEKLQVTSYSRGSDIYIAAIRENITIHIYMYHISGSGAQCASMRHGSPGAHVTC
jgi:hypothetical protein